MSLPSSFSSFLVNFHMNKIEVTLFEPIAMLRTAEADFDYGKGKVVLVPINTKGKGKKKHQKKKGKLGASGNVAKDWMEKLAAEGACFQCGKTRHWKKDCCMFMIELNLALNSSSSRVLDTGCGTNLCNSVQGLRKVRKLGVGELDLRLGDGSRIIAQAIR
ncbi:hypothetical protein CFOL_v3_06931, partial [Cephalotus follicularis]